MIAKPKKFIKSLKHFLTLISIINNVSNLNLRNTANADDYAIYRLWKTLSAYCQCIKHYTFSTANQFSIFVSRQQLLFSRQIRPEKNHHRLF